MFDEPNNNNRTNPTGTPNVTWYLTSDVDVKKNYGSPKTDRFVKASTVSQQIAVPNTQIPSSVVHGSARPENPGFGSALRAHGLTKSRPGPWAVAGPSRRFWGRKPRLCARDTAWGAEVMLPRSFACSVVPATCRGA